MKMRYIIVLVLIFGLFVWVGASAKIGHGIHQDSTTALGSIDFNVAPSRNFEVVELRIHLGAASDVTGLAVVTNDGLGATYDTTVFVPPSTETSVTDVVWRPGDGLILKGTDSLDIDLTLNGSTTHGVILSWKER